jgi:hypothetical protein
LTCRQADDADRNTAFKAPLCYIPDAMTGLQTTMYQPGRRVRVVQQIPRRDGTWTNVTEGIVTRYRQAKTGSWFAHARDDQLWLDRLELRLDDGEIVTLNLDQYTVIEDADGRTNTDAA